MNADLALWYAARAAALAAFGVLGAGLLTGMALRTALLGALARNRAVLALHGFLTWFWVPLIAVHVLCLVLDASAQVGVLDVIVPFRVSYAPTAVGLGTASLLLLVLVAISGAARRRLPAAVWRWAHRLAYPMFVLMLLHAQLAGSDLSRTPVSLVAWALAGMLGVLALTRLAGRRVEPAARGV